MADKKQIAAYVDPGFKSRVRVAAAKLDMSMSELLIQALEHELDRQQAEGNLTPTPIAMTAD